MDAPLCWWGRAPFWRRWRDSNSRALIRCLLHFECRPFNRLGTSPHIFFSWNFVSKPLAFRERLLPGKAHGCWRQAVPHGRPRQLPEKISSQSRYDHFDTAAYKIVKTQTWKTVSIWLTFWERFKPEEPHKPWIQAVSHRHPRQLPEKISSADPSTTWVHLHDIHFSVAMTSQRPLDHATNNTPNPAQNQPPTPNSRKNLSPGAGTRSEARAETRTGPKPGTSPSPPPHQRPGDPHILCRLRRSSSR